MTLIEEKKTLRKACAETRKLAHGTVDAGPALASLAVVLSEKSGCVSFYWPIRTEIDPLPVVRNIVERRDVCLPVTKGRSALTFRPWTPDTILEADGFGVPVPAEGNPVEPDVLIVPLLAFDDQLQRLGYGAGHYDLTLEMLRAKKPVTAIGFAYSAQRCDRVPTEATDQTLDLIVTEQGVLRRR